MWQMLVEEEVTCFIRPANHESSPTSNELMLLNRRLRNSISESLECKGGRNFESFLSGNNLRRHLSCVSQFKLEVDEYI